MSDDFLYKKDINKSVLYDGFGIDREYLDVFLTRISPLERGEKQDITIIFNGNSYSAVIKNLNNRRDQRKNDAYQIRYTADGKFAKSLQACFHKTYSYVCQQQKIEKASGNHKRPFISIPDEYKEYLVFYTTDIPTTFLCEPIIADDLEALRKVASDKSERSFESDFIIEHDETAGIYTRTSFVHVRKLNKKIGEALKEHYAYRCQICGQKIGAIYGSDVVEAHHIDYFVRSLNNDISNLLVVCPNHHSVIHDKNPQFNIADCTYTYPNGYIEGLKLNDHLGNRITE